MIGFGVLGCGSVACAQHLPSLARIRGAAVVAVADPDPAARDRAARLAGGATVHADAAELLARSDVHAVVVAAPPALHAELAVAAARAGKHVYVEKPLATTEADAAAVIEEAGRAGVVAAVGFNRRRHPAFEEAFRLLDAGRIGRVHAVQTAFCEPTDLRGWRSDPAQGGVLLDLASHHVDLVSWLLGAELEAADARGDRDEVVVRFAASTGAEVQSVFSHRAAHADFVELFGELGRLRVDRHGGTVALHRPRRSAYGIRRDWRPTARVLVRRVAGGRGDPSYRRTLEAFVARIGGADVELPSLDDGLRSLRAVLAAGRLAG